MNRRQFIRMAGAGLGLAVIPSLSAAPGPVLLHKPIPSSGERIPAIGMGTWITFNVGDDPVARAQRIEVLRTFFAHGGGMIDSSPMYGSAEEVVGDLLSQLGEMPGLFAATKAWTSSGEDGPAEIEASRKLWGVGRFNGNPGQRTISGNMVHP